MTTYKRKFTTYSKNISFYFIFILMMIIAYPQKSEILYASSYILNGIFLFIISILVFSKKKTNILEPIYLITMIYAIMYFLTPMVDVSTKDYLWFGYDLFPYSLKASFIAFTGYLFFYISYKFNVRPRKIQLKKEFTITPNSKISMIIIIMYIICLIPSVYYIMRSGNVSFLYVISLGLVGSSRTESVVIENLGFLSMLSYSLPTVTLLYYEFGKSKVIKFIFFAIMIILQTAMGYRFIIVQIAVMFFAYYSIRYNRQPNFIRIILSILLIMIPIIIMTIFRDSLRQGSGMQLSSIDSETIFEGVKAAVLDNFRIYQNYYGMVGVIPERFNYVYGRQIIIGTIVMVIPRIIWPNKISSYGGVGLKELIGSNIASGQAYPNLGEYYYAFGVVGVILLMSIYGLIMKKVKYRFLYSTWNIDHMIYSVLLGCNLQIIIRGYTPSNVYLVLFSLLPIYFIKFYSKKKIVNRKGNGANS